MNKIIFIPQHSMCGKEIDFPKPAAHSVEQWYKDAPKFARRDGSPGTLEEAKRRKSFATFKNCVSFFDIMTAGYTFDTVCDIKVFKDKDGKTKAFLIEVKPKAQTVPPKVQTKATKRYINEVATWGVNSAKWKMAEQYCADRGWEFIKITEDDLF